jgi:hypothetical protein
MNSNRAKRWTGLGLAFAIAVLLVGCRTLSPSRQIESDPEWQARTRESWSDFLKTTSGSQDIDWKSLPNPAPK